MGRWRTGKRNGLEVVEIETATATATIALQGAQVLSFVPRGGRDRLWVSERARWAPGAALRGGIPICFPWFGPHPSDRALPAHGFARTRVWPLARIAELDDDHVQVELALSSDEATAALYPHRFEARLTVTVGAELELAFAVANPGSTPLSFEVALHSYFAVSDVAAVAIEGLGGCAGASLRIDSAGAGSTVVWNPAPSKTARLDDMAHDGYRRFVCVETGAIGNRRIVLAPGARHEMTVRYTG